MRRDTLRIATRESPLALWQANHVRARLLAHWPGLHVELLPMTTSGDQFLIDKLQTVGGKGLFVKELEEALFDGRADLAVHSMKDVPSTFPLGLKLTTICARENPMDALVSPHHPSLHALPQGAIIGTSSLRRQAQLLAIRPDVIVHPLRGNVGTRLSKLDAGEYDAIILAAAGLYRLNQQQRIAELLTEDIMLPACGQGALGIECREDDPITQAYAAPLHDTITAMCVQTERLVNAHLGGTCHTPIAIYCHVVGNALVLKAKIASSNGNHVLTNIQRGALEHGALLAEQCAHTLIAEGALTLLQAQA